MYVAWPGAFVCERYCSQPTSPDSRVQKLLDRSNNLFELGLDYLSMPLPLALRVRQSLHSTVFFFWLGVIIFIWESSVHLQIDA